MKSDAITDFFFSVPIKTFDKKYTASANSEYYAFLKEIKNK